MLLKEVCNVCVEVAKPKTSVFIYIYKTCSIKQTVLFLTTLKKLTYYYICSTFYGGLFIGHDQLIGIGKQCILMLNDQSYDIFFLENASKWYLLKYSLLRFSCNLHLKPFPTCSGVDNCAYFFGSTIT